MRLRLVGVILALAWAFPALAQVSDAESTSIAQAVHRGDLIYAYDQAAWHGTDDFMKKARDVIQRSGGWVVDGPADSPELVFFDQDAEHPHALYVAQFQKGAIASSVVLGDKDDRLISTGRLRMIAALRAARSAFYASGSTVCSQKRPNTVVLPPETADGPILVYFLEPQPTMDSFSIGGSYRLEVGSDGKVGAPHAFAKSCLTLTKGQGDRKVAAVVVSHLLDPVPTELHVFAMHTLHVPVFVATEQNRKLWAVADGGIRLVDSSKFKK